MGICHYTRMIKYLGISSAVTHEDQISPGRLSSGCGLHCTEVISSKCPGLNYNINPILTNANINTSTISNHTLYHRSIIVVIADVKFQQVMRLRQFTYKM